MNAWTNFSASETLHMFRSLAMFLRWKNAVLKHGTYDFQKTLIDGLVIEYLYSFLSYLYNNFDYFFPVIRLFLDVQ